MDLYIENMLFWSHPDRRLKAHCGPKHLKKSPPHVSLFLAAATCGAENLLAIYSLSLSVSVGVRVLGNFLLSGLEEREAETGTLRLARRASTAGAALCTSLYWVFLRVYRVYTSGGGQSMHSH